MAQKLFNAAKPSIATTVTDGGDGSFLQAAVSAKFAEVIPALENRMHDLKAEVKKQARHTMHDFAYLLSNQDIAPKIPLLIETMHHPSANSLQAAISALSQTTFVATVTAPVLALIAPLLQRSLANTTTPQEMVRQTLTIVENVVKLVHDPAEARTFALGLKPGVKRAVGQAALPEVRAVATNVQTVIEDVVSIASDVSKVTAEDIARVIDANVKNLDADVTGRNEYTSMRQYVGELVALDVNLDQPRRIASVVSPYIAFFCQIPDALDIAAAVQGFFVRQHDGEHDEPEEEEIVNANFSLGYGGSLLLSQTNLRILRGHKYGVTGRNGVGKSTLLKAIAEGKLEGFPPPGTLRTCLVDYSQNHNESSSVFSYISSESDLIKGGEKRISALLTHYGLTVEDQTRPVSSLSGGNRMKLNLIKAIIKEPDILLLDEPTNHLDEANVEWLVRFLKCNTTSTCLIVSHDPSFLKAVATDYYHFGPYKKLKHFTSSLAAVSEVFPEVRQHDTLLNTSICFTFPAPSILTGVKSPTRTILRMKNVSYTYPKSRHPALKGISCQLSLSSRVSISGRNGAGKSSLVKLMTEEMVPTSGQVEAHPNLRIGYIKQDSLEHVEMHEDKTANQYILWRYAYGDDREVFTKQSRLLSAADRAHLSQPVDIGDGKGPRQIETLVGRQKHLRSFKYEVYVISLNRETSCRPATLLALVPPTFPQIH
jgi:elongation factor 3